ncbi:MAG: glycoside hydrolase family 88 protein [Lachnospiraceae bacterium]|nr:glycoside hydrolase family 88 protein [Lachnospiraceae bacterium]MBO6209050.1 glycoside hydrolase family 88 protein [Lachnospiraceae bacterium]
MTDETRQQIQDYIAYLLRNSSAERPMWNKEMIRENKPNKWNYIDGCMITAILQLYEITGEQKYFDFAKEFIDFFVQEDGTIKTYNVKEYNLDNINTASNLFLLYDKTGDEKYKKALDLVRTQLDTMPRTKENSFWHKDIYPNQVWLDGLYMAEPFYMRYETRFNKMGKCNDVIHQFENVEKYMKDPKTGLYYHGYDESREMYWADPVTGCSPNFWLRALGWFSLALVETAQATDESLYYEKRYLQTLLENLADALKPYQDVSGMFYQVVNRADAKGNYLETSGTALIAYAILKAVRLGFLAPRYAEIGEKAFDGIVEKYLSRDDDGQLKLSGICLVAGLGGKNHRDGSLDYYFSEPVVENEAKGVAPFLLAYTEMLRRN